MRPWIAVAGVFLVVCSMSCAPMPDDVGERPPNLVLIVIDTLRAGDLSCFGAERMTSPRIDALAERSTVFTKTVSVGGNTSTAMAALMTGRLPYFEPTDPWNPSTLFGMARFYESVEERGLPRKLDVLAEILRSRGYRTGSVVSNQYLSEENGFTQGFDSAVELFEGDDMPHGPGEDVSAEAIRFLDTEFREPFFLYLHYMDVHGPYLPPDPYRDLFDYPRIGNDDSAAWNQWRTLSRRRASKFDVTLLRQHMKGLYDGSIRYVDDCVGRVFTQLEEKGLMDRSVIIVTSDHGEEFLEHGGTVHKGSLYQEITAVPLIVYVPETAPRRVESLVRNIDIMPTLLDYAGVSDLPPELYAVSLRGLIAGESPAEPSAVFASFPWSRMYQSQGLKIVKKRGGVTELYNLDVDPGEQQNIITTIAPSRREALEKRLESIVSTLAAEAEGSFIAGTAMSGADDRLGTDSEDWLKLDAGAAHEMDPVTLKRLRELGYVE